MDGIMIIGPKTVNKIRRDCDTALCEMPKYCKILANHIETSLKLKKNYFDQVIINRYKIGQGIKRHTDDRKVFGATIVSISLMANTIMTFGNGKKNIDLRLPRNSAVCLQRQSRYYWTHEIQGGNIEQERISITLRRIKKHAGIRWINPLTEKEHILEQIKQRKEEKNIHWKPHKKKKMMTRRL